MSVEFTTTQSRVKRTNTPMRYLHGDDINDRQTGGGRGRGRARGFRHQKIMSERHPEMYRVIKDYWPARVFNSPLFQILTNGY